MVVDCVQNLMSTRLPRPMLRAFWAAAFLIVLLSLTGCTSPQVTQALINVTITTDGRARQVQLPAGSTVQDAYAKANITPGSLDRSVPPAYTVLQEGSQVQLVRIQEKFETSSLVIPFESQVIKNESMAQGQEIAIQSGANGEEEITYRLLLEDGKEISRSIFKSVIIQEARSEITMRGVLPPFAPLPIQGRLAYLLAGNAWMMDGSTGSRRILVATGDLDGQVFALSPKADWLLFTRKPLPAASSIAAGSSTSAENSATPAGPGAINALWVVSTAEGAKPIDLKVANVINFAAWSPVEARTIAYTTAQPRAASPGWLANNDLQLLTFSETGAAPRVKELVAANNGGARGFWSWWGLVYAFSPDGAQIAYARPGDIGLVDLETGAYLPRVEVPAFETHKNWAWVPGISWSPDNQVIYFVNHPGAGRLIATEDSPIFDLSAITLANGPLVDLVPQAGMFAYPVCSPWLKEGGFYVAYLQAIFRDQSDTSRYQVVVMDRDGSNKSVVFPLEGAQGMEPQQVVWGPGPSRVDGAFLALVYRGDIWIVDTASGETHQVSGDGLTTRLDWK